LKELGDILNDLELCILKLKRKISKETIVEALGVRRKLSTLSDENLVAFAETLSNAGALYSETENTINQKSAT
jgi:hypothetical protein